MNQNANPQLIYLITPLKHWSRSKNRLPSNLALLKNNSSISINLQKTWWSLNNKLIAMTSMLSISTNRAKKIRYTSCSSMSGRSSASKKSWRWIPLFTCNSLRSCKPLIGTTPITTPCMLQMFFRMSTTMLYLVELKKHADSLVMTYWAYSSLQQLMMWTTQETITGWK